MGRRGNATSKAAGTVLEFNLLLQHGQESVDVPSRSSRRCMIEDLSVAEIDLACIVEVGNDGAVGSFEADGGLGDDRSSEVNRRGYRVGGHR
jgi:hypothetical protein